MASTANEPLDPPAEGCAVSYTHLNPITETETREWIPATPFNIVESNAAGCTVGSAPDLLRFGRALQSGQLVNQTLALKLMTGTVQVNPGHSDLQYGYGFFDGITNGVRHVGHGGVAYGVCADFKMLPDLGYTVIVLSNYDPPVAQNLADRIIKIIAALEINT